LGWQVEERRSKPHRLDPTFAGFLGGRQQQESGIWVTSLGCDPKEYPSACTFLATAAGEGLPTDFCSGIIRMKEQSKRWTRNLPAQMVFRGRAIYRDRNVADPSFQQIACVEQETGEISYSAKWTVTLAEKKA
jgi:hypothetical protein